MSAGKKWMHRVNDFLDRNVLPWPVRFLTFQFVILATIALLIPLVVYANRTALVLLINSYLNTMSVAVSSIVLLYATLSEARQKQIAEMQEKRALEDHQHVTEMHTLVLQALRNQDREIEELKQLLAALSGSPYQPNIPEPAPDLRDLHPRGDGRFQEDELGKRWKEQVHQNPLAAKVREDLKLNAEN